LAEVDPAWRVDLGRQRLGELALFLRLVRHDRELVRIEGPSDRLDRDRRPAIRRGAIKLGHGDVLFVDGHARFLE
jgi:prepilin-type processing-associated H-X9-DG protein